MQSIEPHWLLDWGQYPSIRDSTSPTIVFSALQNVRATILSVLNKNLVQNFHAL